MKNKLQIFTPYLSVGNYYFFDSRSEIRKKANCDFKEGKYEIDLLVELYDYFIDLDLKVLYDSKENVNAFEFYSSNIGFNDINLFEMNSEELLSYFKTIDENVTVDEFGLTSNKFGIGIGFDNKKRNIVDSIIVFRRDYYLLNESSVI